MTTIHNQDASQAPIDSVTVFQAGKAKIIRFFDLQLKPGENRVIVNNLSNVVDTNSIRVSGLGGTVRLSDVAFSLPTSGIFRAHGSLHELHQQKKVLEARKEMREQEIELLLSRARADSSNSEVTRSTFLDTLGVIDTHREKSLQAILDIENQLRELEEKISAESEKGGKGLAKSKLTITLNAKVSKDIQEVPLRLRVSYLVSSARWNSIYDLYATSDNTNSVALHYRAQITQSTGESWTNTRLTLSTATARDHEIPRLSIYRVQRVTSFPQPQNQIMQKRLPAAAPVPPPPPPGGLFRSAGFPPPQSVMYQQQQQQQQYQPQQQGLFGASASRSVAFGAAQTMSLDRYGGRGGGGEREREREQECESEAEEDAGDDFVEFDPADHEENELISQPLSEGTTLVKSSSVASSFTVQDGSTIPSDGNAHAVSIASLTCDAKITRVCVPRLGPDVFLQCRVENLSEYRLLPGSVSIFLDEEYVSTASIKNVGASDAFECALGVDPSIQVSYQRKRGKKTIEPLRTFGDTSMAITACNAQTVLVNKSSTVVTDLIVQDSLPLPSDSEEDKFSFQIVLRKPSGLVAASGNELVDVRDLIKTNITDASKTSGLRRKIRWSKIKDGKGGEQEGKYEWVLGMAPGEELTLVADWDVKSPAYINWVERDPGSN